MAACSHRASGGCCLKAIGLEGPGPVCYMPPPPPPETNLPGDQFLGGGFGHWGHASLPFNTPEGALWIVARHLSRKASRPGLVHSFLAILMPVLTSCDCHIPSGKIPEVYKPPLALCGVGSKIAQ